MTCFYLRRSSAMDICFYFPLTEMCLKRQIQKQKCYACLRACSSLERAVAILDKSLTFYSLDIVLNGLKQQIFSIQL